MASNRRQICFRSIPPRTCPWNWQVAPGPIAEQRVGRVDRMDLVDKPDGIVDLDEWIAELGSAEAETWDGIRDALDPVRRLTS